MVCESVLSGRERTIYALPRRLSIGRMPLFRVVTGHSLGRMLTAENPHLAVLFLDRRSGSNE